MNDIIYVGRHALTLRVSDHAHESWELIYCTSGKGQISFEDRTFTYHNDSLVIIPPMVTHSNWSDSGFTNIHVNIVDYRRLRRHSITIQITESAEQRCSRFMAS